jgi:hypothetical protein
MISSKQPTEMARPIRGGPSARYSKFTLTHRAAEQPDRVTRLRISPGRSDTSNLTAHGEYHSNQPTKACRLHQNFASRLGICTLARVTRPYRRRCV